MDTLIVTAHPDPGSLTHQAAHQLQEQLGPDRAVVAHLAQEGFDPRFTPNDRQVYLGHGKSTADVVAEQARIDRATHLVLVFPVLWWSMPALLKGWIDRVFIAGWAFGVADDGIEPRLGRLTAHLLPISGTEEASFERHGYLASLETQIGHGIVDYCGMERGTTAYVYDSESRDHAAVGRALDSAVTTIAAAIEGSDGSPPMPATA